MSTQVENKQYYRAVARAKLNAMDMAVRDTKSQIITDKIIADNVFCGSRSVMLYNAMPTEVNINRLIVHCLDKGIQVYLPRINGDTLDIVEYSQENSIGIFGIKEPIGQAQSPQLDIIITPLLGIDNNLTRLGKGKGYYDRLFAASDALKVAVAFEEQVFLALPYEQHDIKVDICYTDSGVIK